MYAIVVTQATQEPEKPMLVRIYDLRDIASRNAGLHVVVGNWPVRACKQRGYTEKRRLITRDGTPAEVEDAAKSARHISWRYSSLEGLLEDERSLGVSDATIATLSERASRALSANTFSPTNIHG